MTPNRPPSALVLLAHGSNDGLWRSTVEVFCIRLQAAHPEQRIALAYLEHCQPDLISLATDLLASGCRSIRLWPLLIAQGAHGRGDVARLMQQLQALEPELDLSLEAVLLEQPAIEAALLQLAGQWLAQAAE